MKKTPKSNYAILGMLLNEPQSGYEIKKRILESTNHFWQESDASIYPTLAKLAAAGKVKSKSEFVGKRKRTIFEITPAGKKEFLAWMAIPAQEESHRDELLLKLFFGAHTTKAECVKQLLIHQKRLLETQKKFEYIKETILSKVPAQYPHRLFWIMTLQNGLIHVNAEIQWLSECFKMLENKKTLRDGTKRLLRESGMRD